MYTSVVVSILALASTILASPVHQHHQHHVEKRARETVVILTTVIDEVTVTDSGGGPGYTTTQAAAAAAGADNINGGQWNQNGGGGQSSSLSEAAVIVTTTTPKAAATSQHTTAVYTTPTTAAAQEPTTLGQQGTTTTAPAAGNNGGTTTLQVMTSAAATSQASDSYGNSGGDATQISGHKQLTVTVINSNKTPLSTMVVEGYNVPPIVSGSTAAGVMSSSGPGATGVFVFPLSWNGNIAINNGSEPIQGDASLIEPALNETGIIDIDVSYVDGFTVPIVCQCHTAKSTTDVITGCNIDLWGENPCTTGISIGGMCENPLRSDNSPPPLTPAQFFEPCLHAAYVYPRDPGPNRSGVCLTNEVTCCVGTACPPNPMDYS